MWRGQGSTGGCQDPGKVWKGTPMAGRMGGKRRTVQSVWVYKVLAANRLMQCHRPPPLRLNCAVTRAAWQSTFFGSPLMGGCRLTFPSCNARGTDAPGALMRVPLSFSLSEP